MNLDRGKTVWVLGFVFFFSLFFVLFFFFFFFVDKRLVFFIRAWVFFFEFLGERAGGCTIRPVFYFVDKPVFHFVFPG